VTYVPSDKRSSDKEFRLTSTLFCIGIMFLAVATVSVDFFVGTTSQVTRMTDDNHGQVSALCLPLYRLLYAAYQDCEELSIRIKADSFRYSRRTAHLSHLWAQQGLFISERRQPKFDYCYCSPYSCQNIFFIIV
jgi:hypothetical protein